MIRGAVLFTSVLILNCGTRPSERGDAGLPDAGEVEQVDAGPGDSGVEDAGFDAGLVDLDGDGLDDALEARLAQDYLRRRGERGR